MTVTDSSSSQHRSKNIGLRCDIPAGQVGEQVDLLRCQFHQFEAVFQHSFVVGKIAKRAMSQPAVISAVNRLADIGGEQTFPGRDSIQVTPCDMDLLAAFDPPPVIALYGMFGGRYERLSGLFCRL